MTDAADRANPGGFHHQVAPRQRRSTKRGAGEAPRSIVSGGGYCGQVTRVLYGANRSVGFGFQIHACRL